MKTFFDVVGKILRWCIRLITLGSSLAVLFLFIIFLVVLGGLFHEIKPTVPNGAALVLRPVGNVVEKSTIDEFTMFINEVSGGKGRRETVFQDLLDAVNNGATDKRIKMMVIDSSSMGNIGLNQIKTLGRAIENFKKNNKVVIAVGDSFNQTQYYLASYSDEIYMNPMGDVMLHGFGVFRIYLKQFLDDFRVHFHIFKVGSYKSALEPFIRNDMSGEAKEANRVWLSNLWNVYCDDIAQQRGLTPQAIKDHIDKLVSNVRSVKGNSGRLALNAGLIDGLKTHNELEDYLVSLTGKGANGGGYKKVDSADYLDATGSSFSSSDEEDKNLIAVIVCQGNIIHAKGEPEQIASMDISEEIRQARENKAVKALVLRIDSGGGSAFASEYIRQEILRTKQAGKPVVVSMGSMAASGGYWLAADADAILASPYTLTGSIGIFGAFPSFQESLAHYGIFSDGMGTTRIAGDGDPTRTLGVETEQAIQLKVQHGYQQFLEVVAAGRGMEKSRVEKVAEGRVWDGATAQSLGLVDKLGDLNDAVAEAASIAGIKTFSPALMEEKLSPGQEFLKQLSQSAMGMLPVDHQFILLPKSEITRLVELINHHFDFFLRTGDPVGLYSHCLLPPGAFTY
ncbi:MAG: signal peptide peptidase SppA [Desulfobulbaceae bacterium]|nr:signal peptide peptidase SppA [Desulfobulbaceae bacterium]